MRSGLVAVAAVLAACDDGGRNRGAPQWQPTQGDDGDGGPNTTLDVDPLDDSTGLPPEGEGEGGDEGFHCDGEDVQACPCPDGDGEGIQSCVEGMWGPCECMVPSSDTGVSGGSSGGGETGGEASDGTTGMPEPPATEVCYPGADGSYTTCLPLVAIDPDAPPAGYEYPPTLGGDPNYRRPIAVLDLEAIDDATALAPNFTLGELAQAYKGRYGIVQPHAVASLQALRDDNGALNVNSGYRSPDYNLQVGGATYSRHMYGDGFDLDPVSVSIATLEGACTDAGGMLVEYETHVHCDFRFDDVDPAFYGSPDMAAPVEPAFFADVHHQGDVHWLELGGFDEGLPRITWVARDDHGLVLARGGGPMFVAPAGATVIDIDIGHVIDRSVAREP